MRTELIYSLVLILLVRRSATTQWLTCRPDPSCQSNGSIETGEADGSCVEFSDQYQYCRLVGDDTKYHITAFYLNDSSCSSGNHSRLAYDRCYDATDFTHFTVNPINADPVNSVNGTDGAASPTTPINANPTNGTGVAVPLDQDHGLSKTELGLVIAFVCVFFLLLVLCIKFRKKIKEFCCACRKRRSKIKLSGSSTSLENLRGTATMVDASTTVVKDTRSQSRGSLGESTAIVTVTRPQTRDRLRDTTATADVTGSRERGALDETTTMVDTTGHQSQVPRDDSTINVTIPKSRLDFPFAIICVLASERNAVEALFEATFSKHASKYRRVKGDPNVYSYGMLDGWPVVVASPRDPGTQNAADVAHGLKLSFEHLKVLFVVGVAGGAPRTPDEIDILLGDVIISTAVVQYDFGRQCPDGFAMKTEVEDILGRTTTPLAIFLRSLRFEQATVLDAED
ncbi:hypothetical protein LTR56_003610 [Elasticomyces elasticus]|nr:hypothetical protein LTR56_003610 [Elasticomyces elasticus]